MRPTEKRLSGLGSLLRSKYWILPLYDMMTTMMKLNQNLEMIKDTENYTN